MSDFISGLDLGQSADFSALVTVERSLIQDPYSPAGKVNRFDVRHAHRWKLGTPYPKVIEDLERWYNLIPLHGSTLVIDATGVGRPVVDMVRCAQLNARIEAWTITGGLKEGDETVPKKDLVGAVQAALQTSRLRFAEKLPDRGIIEKELENFRAKVTSERNETFAAWRESDHDDYVLALALAVWFGERNGAHDDTYNPDHGEHLTPEYLR